MAENFVKSINIHRDVDTARRTYVESLNSKFSELLKRADLESKKTIETYLEDILKSDKTKDSLDPRYVLEDIYDKCIAEYNMFIHVAFSKFLTEIESLKNEFNISQKMPLVTEVFINRSIQIPKFGNDNTQSN